MPNNIAGCSFDINPCMKDILSELRFDKTTAEKKSKFYSAQTLKAEDFKVEVEGIGAIENLSEESIQELIKLSKHAKFGRGEKTVLDKNVRYTQEIGASKLNITVNNVAFDGMLDKIRFDLGLPQTVKLQAHIYNMLVYGPGQFFKPHQDSEKLENMIATLVVALPFSHIGGALIIRHNKSQFRFITETIKPQDIKCVAFYTDCEHEVQPVSQGHRIVLTYNLVLEGPEMSFIQNSHTENLEQKLQEYFKSKSRLFILLLSHQYSEHGLKWSLLKGSDYRNMQILRTVAHKLELEPSLALIEMYELWCNNCDESDLILEDFIESSVSILYEIDEHGKELKRKHYKIAQCELCSHQAISCLKPEDQTHVGFTGNEGCTSEYWYKQAALILRKRSGT